MITNSAEVYKSKIVVTLILNQISLPLVINPAGNHGFDNEKSLPQFDFMCTFQKIKF
jgi:hypothetical protein